MATKKAGVHREKTWKYETGAVKEINGKTFYFRGWYGTKREAQKAAERKRKRGSLARVYVANAPDYFKTIPGYGRKQYGVWECENGRKQK